jgi:hypothetical protein
MTKSSQKANPENDPKFRKELLKKIKDEFDEFRSVSPELFLMYPDVTKDAIQEEFEDRLFRARGPESKLKRTIIETGWDNELTNYETNELPTLKIDILGKSREIEVVISSDLTEETTFLHTLHTNTL